MGYPPLRKISPVGLVVPLTRPAGAATFNDKNLGCLKYLKCVPYTDAFNDTKTWTKNYILKPLDPRACQSTTRPAGAAGHPNVLCKFLLGFSVVSPGNESIGYSG